MKEYFRYWGKAKSNKESGAPYHLLPYHNLDVAAVGQVLLATDYLPISHLAQRLSIDPERLCDLLVFMLGLHDIGKFARSFQGLVSLLDSGLVPPVPRYENTVRHDCLGAVLWHGRERQWRRDGLLNWPTMRMDRRQRAALGDALAALWAPIFGHHGQPVDPSQKRIEQFFAHDDVADDVEAARAFVADWAALMAPDWPLEQMLDKQWLACWRQQSWRIAGWAVVSDWLGSNEEYFRYNDREMALPDYWYGHALRQARDAVKAAELDRRPVPVPFQGIGSWFDRSGIVATPLQQQAEQYPVETGPQLFVLEDLTGAGKTEAACILTQRLLAAGAATGLFFALPTMATSNAMYERLGVLHRRFFTADSEPSCVLAHGARELNKAFRDSIRGVQGDDDDYAANESSNAAACSRWLADSRKKALLADVGVGTIDQVLMGLLPFRHQSLRLFGLAGKVLIIDEVHAYDMYMQRLLERLLEYHAGEGGSVILLTATLPLSMREALTAAWQCGSGAPVQSPQNEAFPLFTAIAPDGSVVEQPLTTPETARRDVAIEWLTDESTAIDLLLAAVQRGECVAWVRNTVDDAIRAYETIRAAHPEPERCTLFHARYAMIDRQRIESDVLGQLGKNSGSADRRGRVLIATQVFQESLDCDVDRLISDIAPIDALIQRAGRLQRHGRGERAAPTLHVLAPHWKAQPDDQWLRRFLPGTHAVYQGAELCWLTQRILREKGGIHLPRDARELVESVYGETAEALLPEGLTDEYDDRAGKSIADRGIANFNALDLSTGYGGGSMDHWQPEQDIGTRLVDEPSRQVVLLREVNGQLVLWAGDVPYAPVFSQIRLRESQCHKLAALPSTREAEWECLQQRYRALAFATPWMANNDDKNWYDAVYGLRLGET